MPERSRKRRPDRRALLAAAGLAGLLRRAAGAQDQPGSPYGDLKEVTLQGKLVSLQEELARKYGARPQGAGETQWALALPEGQYFTFFDNRSYRELLAAGLGGKAVEVRARLFPRSQLLELLSHRPIPAESIQRRFYCSVCDIHATDFGPCACCGREYELVKPDR